MTEKTEKCLKLVKENEALPSPWIVAGTGRLSQGHWWNFMSAASRSMGRDYEAPVLLGGGEVARSRRMKWTVGSGEWGSHISILS